MSTDILKRFPSVEPRPYQLDAWERLQEARAAGQERALIQMATGLGKTLVAAVDALNYQQECGGGRILFVCHIRDISEQAGTVFRSLRPNLKNAEFTTFQSLLMNLKSIPPDYYDYIIYDETHHIEAVTFKKVRTHFTPKFALGLTATPTRADGRDILQYFGKPVYKKTFSQAMSEGWLVSVDYRLLFDSAIKEAMAAGFDLVSGKAIRRLFSIPARNEVIAQNVHDQRHAIGLDNAKTIVFCQNVRHAREMAKLLGGEPYYSTMPIVKRRATLASFRKGQLQLICTINAFNEGVDIPDARVLVFLRSTSSRTIFEQQLGRGLRKSPGKKMVTVLDFAANIERLKFVKELGSSYVHHTHTYTSGGGGSSTEANEPGIASHFEFDAEVINVLERLESLGVGGLKPLPKNYMSVPQMALLTGRRQSIINDVLKSEGIELPVFRQGNSRIRGIPPDMVEKIEALVGTTPLRPRVSGTEAAARTAAIVKRYLESNSGPAVAEEFGISSNAVYKHLRKAGVPYSTRYQTRLISTETLIEKYREKQSLSATARHFGINVQTIKERFEQVGFTWNKLAPAAKLPSPELIEAYNRLGSATAAAREVGMSKDSAIVQLKRSGMFQSKRPSVLYASNEKK
jgi:superfamily II DNA or RNA helicase/transposase